MEFPNSYFEDEVRGGFYVPSLMKRAWAAQLEVLDGIHKVCKKHNIQYFAEWGSLLGAVRHGGMIPWDDDLDICMKGKDFEKFLTVVDELPEGSFFWDYHHSDDIDNMVCRIQNTKHLIIDQEDMMRYHGYPYAVGIDIFRLDYLPPVQKEEEEFKTIIEFLCAVIGMLRDRKEKGESVNTEKMESMYERVEKLCCVELDREKPLKMQLYDVLNRKISSLYSETEAREITDLALWSGNPNYRMPKECFSESILLPFENTEIAVPVGYEQLLRKKYGDRYMQPVRAGGSHEYPFYEEQQKKSKENMEIEFFQYRITEHELEPVPREPKEGLKQKVREFLPLFREAHENILLYVQDGEIDAASEILSECQNVAIQLGTMIEEERGDGCATVATLEQYCEDVFVIHTLLSEGASECYGTARRTFTDFEKKMSVHIEQDLKERKEVVFLPYKVSYWKTMEWAWQKAMDDPDTDVYVIPIPYYYKDVFGTVMEEEICELDYPEEVTLTSYQEYNFQVHHPDVIVMQYPYDEYNFALSIRPFFYGRNIKKYTDQLVYIPPFVMDEIGPEDERARKTLKSLCNMPGVVHADTVVVQSEQMKRVYVELLTEFAGEETKELWEKKIYGLESPRSDSVKRDLSYEDSLPDEWQEMLRKPDGTKKKVILYSTSASALMMSGEKMIAKMETNFQVFQENCEEVLLWWRPDKNVRAVLRKRNPVFWRKYHELVQKFCENHWGIYDDSPDVKRAVTLCDAGYGDGGIVLNACQCQKKPVMIQNVDT